MTRDGLVSGVTSAAIVWLLAAVGSSIGFKHYGVAVTISILAVIILIGVEQIENVFKKNLRQGVYRRDSE
jgi:putative Mg2+ transporter-C (MgtC) family protein